MKIAKQSVELIDYMGSDLSVVNAARVSFHKESEYETVVAESGTETQDLSGKDKGLIAYLARHGHWTPFGHAVLSFRIKSPIFVARQLVKHQVGLVWNEVSRRYVDDEPEFWFPEVWRGKPVNAKQGSSDVVLDVDNFDELHGQWTPKELCQEVVACYSDLIAKGVAPEQARIVLPQNMMTEWIWTGSLMAFARVCKLRLDAHAQQETREVAQLINTAVPDSFKYSWAALLSE